MHGINTPNLSNGCLDSQPIAVKFDEEIEKRNSVSINLASPQAPGSRELAVSYVRIRPLRSDDTQALYAAALESIGQLSQWMTWATPNYSSDECRLFVTHAIEAWQLQEYYTFAVIDARDNSLLGSIGLNHLDRNHMFANVGYWVRTTRTRSGIGSAMSQAAAKFGFSVLGLRRLEFLIPTTNIASQRVAQRAGAKFEGILRNRLVLTGQSHDAAVYSLVPGDLVGIS